MPKLILSYMTKTTILHCTRELEMCQMKGKKKTGLLFICHQRRSGLIGNIFPNTAIIHGRIPGFVVNFVTEQVEIVFIYPADLVEQSVPHSNTPL